MAEGILYSGFQLRRMGFDANSPDCMIEKLPIGDFYIGRICDPSWNFMNLNSYYVSRIHCKIICDINEQIFLEDTSRNGIYLNGIKYNNTVIELRENDRIGLGFPITELHARNNKSVFGFILEREEQSIDVIFKNLAID